MPEEVLPDERWEMSERLDDNEQRLKRKFDKCSDFYIRKIVIADSFPILIAFIEGMVDAKHADTALIEPLLRCREAPPNHPDEMLKWLQKECLPVLQTEIVDKPDEPVKRIVKRKRFFPLRFNRNRSTASRKNRLQKPSSAAFIWAFWKI